MNCPQQMPSMLSASTKRNWKNESKEEDPEQPIQINQGAMLATMTQKLKLGKILPEHKSHRATEY